MRRTLLQGETTKIVESSYRAAILAFLNEWSLLAVVDWFGIVDDAAGLRTFEHGCEVKALGRGHI